MAIEHIAKFKDYIATQGWALAEEKAIDHGTQVVVNANGTRVNVNFYTTGTITPGGKAGPAREAIEAWIAQARQTPISNGSGPELNVQKHRSETTYFVLNDRIDRLWHDVILTFPATVQERQITGAGQLYAAEIREGKDRVVLTQYHTGNLLVQGASSVLFELVCLALDEHLSQNLQQRASRFIVSEPARQAAETYMRQPKAEDEATDWLNRQLPTEVQQFLHHNDLLTLRSGVAVKIALSKVGQALPDYSVVVAGFGRAFEGFLIRLAEHLGLATEEQIRQEANAIQIGGWISVIEERLPDKKRYSADLTALESAWQCRNKAMHSDRFHPYQLTTPEHAEQEIMTILRAMSRAHAVFVAQGIKLGEPVSATTKKAEAQTQPPKQERRLDGVDRDALAERLRADRLDVRVLPPDKRNEWEVITESLKVIAPRSSTQVIVSGNGAEVFCRQYGDLLAGGKDDRQSNTTIQSQAIAYAGVDESGKGDVFGPLVVAAVAVTPEIAQQLRKASVRDSKLLDARAIETLAAFIRQECTHVVLCLMPSDYNEAYRDIGSNLNRLLARQHARAVKELEQRTRLDQAISDQFASDASVLTHAFAEAGVAAQLIQRHQAEADIAVAAASILARDAFVTGIQELEAICHCLLPLGSSSDRVRKTAEDIKRRHGSATLRQVAKAHFSTVSDLC